MHATCKTTGCERLVRTKKGTTGRPTLYCTLHASDRHARRSFCLRCWSRLGRDNRKRLCRTCISERGVIHDECRAFAKTMLRDARINAGYKPHVGPRRRPNASAAERRFVDAGYVLNDEYINADTPCRVRCKKCKTLQSVRLAHLNNYVCGGCTERGRNIKPHKVYLAINSDANVAKVGVTSNLKHRTQAHRRAGFTIVRTWAFADGFAARQAESDVLLWWRTTCELPWARDAKVFARSAPHRTAGLTETAPLLQTPLRLTEMYLDGLAAAHAQDHVVPGDLEAPLALAHRSSDSRRGNRG